MITNLLDSILADAATLRVLHEILSYRIKIQSLTRILQEYHERYRET